MSKPFRGILGFSMFTLGTLLFQSARRVSSFTNVPTSLFHTRATFGAGTILRSLIPQSVNNNSFLILGCYWGTEKYFKHDFGRKSFPGSGLVTSGKVGFMGPPTAKQNPTYEEVMNINLKCSL